MSDKEHAHKEDLAFGGQAVIEGIMMRSKHHIAVSVRQKGKIVSKLEELPKNAKYMEWVFVRGIVNLVQMLSVGIRALLWSADQQLEKEEKISKFEVVLTLLISLGAGVFLFIIVPFFLTALTQTKGILFNLIDGLIRVAIFILYVILISLMKDVKRLFMYHGAEHKAVHCYEAGKELTYENVKEMSTRHPRCGTSFVFILLLISIAVFSLVTSENMIVKICSRIVLLPVIASVSYELLKLSGRFRKNKIVALLSAPGLWIQRLTTKEPDKEQVEVAIHSLKLVIGAEKKI